MGLNNLIFLAEVAHEADTTSGEAALNTFMGITIVFLTLAFIACVIAIEGKIFTTIAKKKASPKTVAPKADDEPAPAVADTTEIVDTASQDEEIVAVITAAIAAFEAETGYDVPADALVVRSIRRLR